MAVGDGRVTVGALAAAEDDLLLTMAKGGHARAFEVLCERYRRQLFVFCMRQVGDRHLAEDLVQETLSRAWARLETCVSWRGWVFTIARNLCVSHMRADPSRNGKVVTIGLEQLDLEVGGRLGQQSTPELFEQRDRALRLLRRTPSLSPRQKRVVEQRMAGLPFRDIAQQLGVSEKLARQTAYDARRRLAADD